ncbi:MAG: ABC transporter permease [Phycisphaerales bacterium]|nr:ABC transporter permease [Phycisphaerales bacterium]
MYKLHLILKYLRKRRIAWVSLAAVMLCTTMVLVVISVMGGWLRMFRSSFQGLSGEVIVSARHPSGFPYYQEMADRIEKLPGVGTGKVVPVIRTFGLINIGNLAGNAVQVFGYPLDQIGNVNKFPESLWRQYQRYDEALHRGTATHLERVALGLLPQTDDNNRLIWTEGQPDADPTPLSEAEKQILREKIQAGKRAPSFNKPLATEQYRLALKTMNPRAPQAFLNSAADWQGMIAGVGVIEIDRDRWGAMTGRQQFKYELPVKLTVLGIDPVGTGIDVSNKSERSYWIVDDSHTGVWQYDSESVYVPFDVLQRDLKMNSEVLADQSGSTPARTSELHVGIDPKVDMDQVRDQVEKIVSEVYVEHGVLSSAVPRVQTWKQTQAMFLGAVEKETALVMFLFSLISVVAVFLIFCIFYMIVVEKTRDIGIIKSVGATSNGVMGIFVGYGLTIGIVGSLAGLAVAYVLVRYINEIHAWLGAALNIEIWNPRVYAFDKIPNEMDPLTVVVIVVIAIVASTLGAVIPAIRAGNLNPIQALRHE